MLSKNQVISYNMFTNFKYSLNNKKDTTLSEQFPKLNRKFVEIQAKSIPPNNV